MSPVLRNLFGFVGLGHQLRIDILPTTLYHLKRLVASFGGVEGFRVGLAGGFL